MHVLLKSIDPWSPALAIQLVQFPSAVGTSRDCEVVLESRGVSKEHCEFQLDGDCLYVRDLGSAEGTRLNGKKIRREILKGGDELEIGIRTLRVVITGPALELGTANSETKSRKREVDLTP